MGNGHDLFAALDRYGADTARWPQALAPARDEALASDPAFAKAWREMAQMEEELVHALAIPSAPPAYAAQMALRALERARLLHQKKLARITFAFGGGWAVAAAAAGLVVGQVLSAAEPDMLTFAEVAMGAASLLAGN